MTGRIIERHYGPAVPAPALRMTAGDGCALNVRVLRAATSATSTGAEPLVFVHALAMDGDMWSGVADALGPGDRALYALDCRGHGASDAPPGPFTTRRFAQDLVDVLDALGQARAHVVGCSMGGTVALALGAAFPARVASLTTIDCSAWYGADAPDRWEQRARTALTEGMAALTGFQVARWFSPDFLRAEPALVREALAVFNANRVPAYAESCRMLGLADEREGLPRFAGPASVIVGADDYATPPSMARDIADRMPDARLTVIPGARHYTPLEAPEAVAQCIRDVIGRTTSHPLTQENP